MGSVLKISEAAAMALHAAAMLAGGNGSPIATRTIADKLKCSEAHLSKVLQRMTKARLLTATRGPRGGFILARPRNQISLLDVYQAIDGELPEKACLFDDPVCDQSICVLGCMLTDVNQIVRKKLTDTTLEGLECTKWGNGFKGPVG